MPNHHELKIDPAPFADLLSGAKTCEVRKDDRGFQVGDTLRLHEREDGDFTGRVLERVISHIQRGYGLPDGICVLSYAHAEVAQGKPVGVVLPEEKMRTGYDPSMGPVVWFGGYPKPGPLYTAPPSPDAELVGLFAECRGIVAKEVERWTRAAAILPVNSEIESALLARIDAKLTELGK